MNTEIELDRDRIKELLTELGRRLKARAVTGVIYVGGGAAIALESDEGRVAVDVDDVFGPAETVQEIAKGMADERGLPSTWLSDRVRAFLPPGEDKQASVFSVPGLDVSVASARYLLAMKMAAGRPQDLHDLILIFRELGISTPEQAADVAQEVHGPDSVLLPPRDELVIYAQAVLNRMGEQPG
jgi:hypothetical protein